VGLPLADDIVKLVCFAILSIAWAWSGGFTLGSLSRATIWVHASLLGLLWFAVATLRALPSGRFHRMLFWLLPLAVLFLIPFLWGVQQGVRGGVLRIGGAVRWAVAIATLTLIVQVEGGREGRAFAAWSTGGAVDGRLTVAPQFLPFAAIIWQSAFMFTTRRRATYEPPLIRN
jgi:hypothetical protein